MTHVKRAAFIAALALLFAASPAAVTRAAPGDTWSGIRGERFLLLGRVGEQELQSLAARLEEFERLSSQLLPAASPRPPRAPLVVLVFADEEEYAPFKPLYVGEPDRLVAGYFKAGPDLDYITLSAGRERAATESTLLHEYVHSLVRERYERAPVWFDEGLSEYYSSYELTAAGQQLRVGKRLAGRVQTLRAHGLLPLKTLLTADRHSPFYNDHDKRGIFYAQSWALVHYFMSDPAGERPRQLQKFVELLSGGTPAEDAATRSLGVGLSTLESRLAEYVRSARFPESVKTLAPLRTSASASKPFRLTEAEAQAQLGDLLLRTDRRNEARSYLERALALDASLPAVHLSLGILHLEEGCLADAKGHLQSAVAADPRNHLARYHHADLLRREGAESESTIEGYAERTSLIRAELKKAIELAPDFLNAYGLLALVDVERSPRLDEAAALLARASSLAPDRREFKLLLARLQLRREEFDLSRATLRELLDDPLTNSFLRAQARSVFDSVEEKERAAAKRGAQGEPFLKEPADRAALQPCDMPEPGPQVKPVRFTGEQVCGRLVRIECVDEGVRFLVEAGGRTVLLHSDALERVNFVTYVRGVRGAIGCGERPARQPVLVTYRKTPRPRPPSEGEVLAIEFLPEDWFR